MQLPTNYISSGKRKSPPPSPVSPPNPPTYPQRLRYSAISNCRLGLEGIVSKRADSAYKAGRSKMWLKIKTVTTPP